MSDRDIVTDPDVLTLYDWRISMEPDVTRLMVAVAQMATDLKYIATRPELPAAEWAASCLTEVGERSTPLRDEGVPCVF